MKSEKYASINCNVEFLKICTQSICGMSFEDPLGENFYFNLDDANLSIGIALTEALQKSVDISGSEETKKAIKYLQERAQSILADYEREHPFDGSTKACQARNRIERNWWFADDRGRSLMEIARNKELPSVKDLLKRYGYKDEKAMQQNMQYCSVLYKDGTITLSPYMHSKLKEWKGMNEKFNLTILSTSSPEVIGAAVKYSISRCKGKGADLVAKKLFPDGVPETFDDYLALLNLELYN